MNPTYYIEDNKYKLPPVISSDKLGRETKWKIWVEEQDSIVRIGSSFQIGKDGKVSISYVAVKTGKNIGKKNETSVLDQALNEAYSKYTKKKDLSRPIQTVNESVVVNVDRILPMLAQKYEERGKKYLKVPFAVSPKLDGVRMISRNKVNEIELYSRTGKVFHNLDSIRRDLNLLYQGDPNLLLDGECYSHDLDFNQISGITRSQYKSELDDKVQFWIFDIINDNETYKDRMKHLRRLAEYYHARVHEDKRSLRFVYYETIDHSQVESFHTKYVGEGYEGIILRNLDGLYLTKNRSNDCQKYKQFQDEEFEIVSYKAGRGTDEGAIIFKCKTNSPTPIGIDAVEFDCRIHGSIEHRRELYKIGNTLIGKLLTVRYQEKDELTGVPRFPVGVCIRDYE